MLPPREREKLRTDEVSNCQAQFCVASKRKGETDNSWRVKLSTPILFCLQEKGINWQQLKGQIVKPNFVLPPRERDKLTTAEESNCQAQFCVACKRKGETDNSWRVKLSSPILFCLKEEGRNWQLKGQIVKPNFVMPPREREKLTTAEGSNCQAQFCNASNRKLEKGQKSL